MLASRVCGICLGRISESCFNTADSVYTWMSFITFLPYISCAKKQKWATRQVPVSMLATESDVSFALPPWSTDKVCSKLPVGKLKGATFPRVQRDYIHLLSVIVSSLNSSSFLLKYEISFYYLFVKCSKIIFFIFTES